MGIPCAEQNAAPPGTPRLDAPKASFRSSAGEAEGWRRGPVDPTEYQQSSAGCLPEWLNGAAGAG